VSSRQEQGPRSDQRKRKCSARALSIGLTLTALFATEATAQTLTSDMLRGERDGFTGQIRPLRRTTEPARNTNNDQTRNPNNADAAAPAGRADAPAPSRIGQIPKFEAPAAAGASSMGFDSLNRKKKKPAKPKPGVSPSVLPKEPVVGAPVQITPIVPVVPPPPPLPSAATANKPHLAPSMEGKVVGQPLRRKLKVDDDPFGAVGFYRGSMLVKPAIELWTGYDTNPGRVSGGKGSWLYMVAPELLIASDWERHSLIADLRGSFTGYSLRNDGGCDCATGVPTVSPLPVDINRPDFTGKVNGRVDISRDTRIDTETRLHVGTDNPGSPNIQANLQRYPLFASFGGTLGGAHTYNRFEVAAKGTVDRNVYQESTLSDGSRSSNEDRNFNQYGGTLRGSYEIMPHVKPFGEVQIDRRERDLEFDRNGFARNSNGRTARVGSTFELGRLVTGEASIGYTTRSYEDERLSDAKGLLAAGSLVWRPTGLTTVTVGAQSSIDESTLPGVSGVVTRSYNAQVEHAFRRYLIATLKAGFTTADYDGSDRFDKIYSVGGDLVYKLNRDVHLKAQLRHDWLKSTIESADYQATLFMLGVRLQR
jgi:hypothetical protein